MAIYHINVKIGRRSDEQSARAAACYVLRTGPYEADFNEVLYSTSGHMPDFAAAEPLRFWDAADTFERANGRLFRSLEFALPIELDEDRRRDLAVMFAHRLTADEKLPYTLAIHAGKGHNPHCHLLINERQNDGIDRPAELWFRRHNNTEPERGGAKKSDSLVTKSWLRNTREAWADACNETLADAGQQARIDHRTLEAQGIDRKPGKHLGPELHKMLKKGIDVEIAAEIGMTAADIGPPAPSPFAPAPRRAVAPEAGKGRPEASRGGESQARTAQAIERQSTAMGCRSFSVGILDARTGELVEYHWTLKQIIENLRLLRQANAQGREILIRPATHPLTGLVLVDGLSQESVERMRSDGYEPTVTLETAPDQYQVWVRAGENIRTSRRTDVARYLTERYDGDVDAAGANTYGRLAGFTSSEPAATGRRPYVLVKWSDTSGKIASGAAELMRITLESKKQRQKRGPTLEEGGPEAN